MDFEEYYENYIDKLLSTYEYFEGIKYPSDEQENKKGWSKISKKKKTINS